MHEVIANFNINNNFNNKFVIYGNNFSKTTSVLLSTNKALSGTQVSLSSKYTGSAIGYTLSSQYYEILTDNILTISLPKLSGASNFNFIISNDAGWDTSYNINNFTFTNT